MKVVYEIMEHGEISQFICRSDEETDFTGEIAKAIELAFVKDVDVCIGPSASRVHKASADHAIITASSRAALQKIRWHLTNDLQWIPAGELRKTPAARLQ